MEWPALESDPEIFSNYFRSLGLGGFWKFEEVYEMHENILCSALLLAYKKISDANLFDGEPSECFFFIKQVSRLDNACGLLAGLHCILNTAAGLEIQEGSLLENIRDSIIGLGPEESAQVLVGNESLKSAHQSFAREGQTASTHRPKHHFVALLPDLVVLDGKKPSPIKLGSGEFKDFFPILQNAIANGIIGEDISLMALNDPSLF